MKENPTTAALRFNKLQPIYNEPEKKQQKNLVRIVGGLILALEGVRILMFQVEVLLLPAIAP